IAQLPQIGAGGVEFEARGRPRLRSERLDRVREPGVAAVELRAGVVDFEELRRPVQRAVERRGAVVVDAEQIAREGGRQIAAVLEQMERAVEVAITLERPR